MAAPFNPKAALRVRARYEKMFVKTQNVKRTWFRNNYKKVYLNPTLPEDKIPKKAIVLYNELMKIEKEAATLRERRLQQEKNVEIPVEEEKEESQLSVQELLARGPMYPVPENVKRLLYHGISHNDEGRKLYLKTRNKKGVTLEEKYYRPLSESQTYGWLVEQRFIPTKRYGQRYVIKQSFMRRNGVLKFDSDFWRKPQSKTVASFLS